jgi:hypothetical protein
VNRYVPGIKGQLFRLTPIYIVERLVFPGKRSAGASECKKGEQQKNPQAWGGNEENPVTKRVASIHVGDLDINQ